MNKWTQEDAIKLCRDIEKICPAYGCHVALTGGNMSHYISGNGNWYCAENFRQNG